MGSPNTPGTGNIIFPHPTRPDLDLGDLGGGGLTPDESAQGPTGWAGTTNEDTFDYYSLGGLKLVAKKFKDYMFAAYHHNQTLDFDYNPNLYGFNNATNHTGRRNNVLYNTKFIGWAYMYEDVQTKKKDAIKLWDEMVFDENDFFKNTKYIDALASDGEFNVAKLYPYNIHKPLADPELAENPDMTIPDLLTKYDIIDNRTTYGGFSRAKYYFDILGNDPRKDISKLNNYTRGKRYKLGAFNYSMYDPIPMPVSSDGNYTDREKRFGISRARVFMYNETVRKSRFNIINSIYQKKMKI